MTIQLPNTTIGVQYLNRIFDSKAESYKLFWFQAIVRKIEETGRDVFSYEELVDEMIASAWYKVSEYHLNLGPADHIERTVLLLAERTGLPSNVKREDLLACLKASDDKDLRRNKMVLIDNVPYRLQSAFLQNIKGNKQWNVRKEELIVQINMHSNLIYYIGPYQYLHTEIVITPAWKEYILANREIIDGWIQYNLISYLQRRNPNVPGIINKLEAPQQRDLNDIKKYWKAVIDVQEVRDIYSNTIMTVKNLSIDHFVPWSYVSHDEFWNLLPTPKNVNSSKSNNLPDWDVYFEMFSRQEYEAYQLTQKAERVREYYNKCLHDHVNDDYIREKLYRPDMKREEFNRALSEVLHPVYESAKNCGFHNWVCPQELRYEG